MTGDLSHPVNPGNTPSYTLGLFTNMYPAFEGDYRGIFIRQMVTDLEERGVKIFIAAKPTPSLLGYISFAARSVRLARRKDLDLLQAEYIPHSSLIPALLGRRTVPIILKFHGDDARIFPFKNRVNMALTRAMIRRAAHIVTASEEIRKTLIDIGAPSDRVTAIHSGGYSLFLREATGRRPGPAWDSRPKRPSFSSWAGFIPGKVYLNWWRPHVPVRSTCSSLSVPARRRIIPTTVSFSAPSRTARCGPG